MSNCQSVTHFDRDELSRLKISNNLSDFEDLGEIGRGQFGSVHKVRLKSHPTSLLCWKCLNYRTMPEREKRQLQQEVLLLESLDHSNVIKCVGRINDRQHAFLYLIMEFCENGDMAQFLELTVRRGSPIPEQQIHSWFSQIVNALYYCHTLTNKVFHRDLKPQNILLCDDYRSVKLGDFGLAKMLQPAQSFTQTHVGTPYYMSPEVLHHKKYDTKSDIWALGCLLYEMATGLPPYGSATSYDNLKELVNRGTYSPLPHYYSDAFKDLIKQLLTNDPRRRPSASTLKRHLLYKEGMIHSLMEESKNLRRKVIALRRQMRFDEKVGKAKDAKLSELTEQVAQLSVENAQLSNELQDT